VRLVAKNPEIIKRCEERIPKRLVDFSERVVYIRQDEQLQEKEYFPDWDY